MYGIVHKIRLFVTIARLGTMNTTERVCSRVAAASMRMLLLVFAVGCAGPTLHLTNGALDRGSDAWTCILPTKAHKDIEKCKRAETTGFLTRPRPARRIVLDIAQSQISEASFELSSRARGLDLIPQSTSRSICPNGVFRTDLALRFMGRGHVKFLCAQAPAAYELHPVNVDLEIDMEEK